MTIKLEIEMSSKLLQSYYPNTVTEIKHIETAYISYLLNLRYITRASDGS